MATAGVKGLTMTTVTTNQITQCVSQ